MDQSMIGNVAAELMDTLPGEIEGEIVAVGLVVVVDDGDGTYTRVKCSTDRLYEQMGLFAAALEVVTHGTGVDD